MCLTCTVHSVQERKTVCVEFVLYEKLNQTPKICRFTTYLSVFVSNSANIIVTTANKW